MVSFDFQWILNSYLQCYGKFANFFLSKIAILTDDIETLAYKLAAILIKCKLLVKSVIFKGSLVLYLSCRTNTLKIPQENVQLM